MTHPFRFSGLERGFEGLPDMDEFRSNTKDGAGIYGGSQVGVARAAPWAWGESVWVVLARNVLLLGLPVIRVAWPPSRQAWLVRC